MRIDIKNMLIPFLNIFVRSTITRASTVIGIKVTKYEINILIMLWNVKEFELNITPVIVEITITNKRFTNTKIIIAVNFAVKNFNLEAGLVIVIFMVF